jgi:putative ABC transport system permease protein
VNLARLSFAYLRAKPLNTVLNLVLLALGVGTIAFVLLVTHQLEERMGRDARGIDLVAGAKGSPMQLILSAVFHLDAPAGNIPLAAANELARNRAVKKAIPLALGDSYRGYRIVGTNHDYVAHLASAASSSAATASRRAARSTASARTRWSGC